MPTWSVLTSKHDRGFCGALGDALLNQADGGFSIIHQYMLDGIVKLTIPSGLCTKTQFEAFMADYEPSDE